MRNVAIVQVGVVVVAALVLVCSAQQQRPFAGDPVGLLGGLQRHAKTARTIRGFKNMALSTARGFGKRADRPPLPPAAAEFEQFDIQIPPQGLPVEWLAEQMATSPALARALLRRFVDVDRDDRLSADELLREL